MTDIVIHWFRQDLRLSDNPALTAAALKGTVLPIYIFDEDNAGSWHMGAASRWWLHYSLHALNKRLNNKLSTFRGKADDILPSLAESLNAKAVYWNRCYEPWRIKRDAQIKQKLLSKGIDTHSENGSLLWEPWAVKKKDGTPYRVFTPFFRKGCLNTDLPIKPLKTPNNLQLETGKAHLVGKQTIDSLALLPKNNWCKSLQPHWQIGEIGARKQLDHFLNNGLQNYKFERDIPALNATSKLSPHLHFGEISPRQVWHAVRATGDNESVDHFCSELGWREFSYSLLYYNPKLPTNNLQKKFDAFPWREDRNALKKWQQGHTGIPIVDAGMRELWQTGFMHNRVRMITGSFLVKNLLLNWQHGEKWFWDCLVDADLANNSASWQWIAGCGADAAPYFRIFNPVTQGKKFDPDGSYTRHFVPELRKLPNQYLFSPWEAPSDILAESGVVLGKDYPEPIVDLKTSRERALSAFKKLK